MPRSPAFFTVPALAAVLLFGANNLWAKNAFPGMWTGKISDFAFCFFMPLFIAYGLESWGMPRRWALRSGAGATILSLVAVKSWPTVSTGLDSVIRTFWSPWGLTPRSNQMDASDLWALPMVILAYIYAIRRGTKNEY